MLALFYLKNMPIENIEENEESDTDKLEEYKKERDLHIILSSFVKEYQNFKCYTKTIDHRKVARVMKGNNEWVFPDIVGIYFPFEDNYKKETLYFQEQLKINNYKIFSFELKLKLDFSNLKKAYFQAVSNSSWANEGYLVALDIDKGDEFIEEITRLNNAFGIGIIKLNPEKIFESEIILPAKENMKLDWDTVDKLTYNDDFKDFIKDITLDIKNKKVLNENNYDKVKNDE